MKSITLNGETYVSESDYKKALTKKGKQVPSKKQIVVLQRGWVVVGDLSEQNGEFVLTDAAIIRRWGTENSLSELAEKGPIPEGVGNGPTKLDKTPYPMRFHPMTVILRLDVDPIKWN